MIENDGSDHRVSRVTGLDTPKPRPFKESILICLSIVACPPRGIFGNSGSMFLAGMRLAVTCFFFESFSPAFLGLRHRTKICYLAGAALITIELAV
jgi:hypothetical protein